MNSATPTDLELAPGETLRARLTLDLAADGRFANGELLLTDRRLLARVGDDTDAQSWWLKPGLVLRHSDSGGLAQLSLHDADQRLALWRFTLAANPQALALLQQFERVQRRLADPGAATDEDGSAEDTDFAAEAPERSSTWVLLRLGRFAHPYRWQLLAGFVLTLGSTAASLVPPYLTIPLMDDVLIPFQNGQRIDPALVGWLLLGLLGAALAAWGLGWAKTWLLALVSERISADLRTATFEHLLNLSLDYFGAKRTGDLMSRIGSETDRISVFLSLHALDFATDVLMIGMTAVILFSIDPGAGAGDVAAAALHRLDDPPGARPAAHRLREDRPRLGRGDQRAGRHHPRHPRRQGLRAGTARGRALPRRQPPQPGGQRPAEQDLDAVRADGRAADRDRPAGGLGLRHLAGLPRTRSRSAC